MSDDLRERPSREPAASIDAARRVHREGATLARNALLRATEGTEPSTDALLDAVPRMLAEARRRRSRRDALSASVPLARMAIPRLAAAAALLVALCAALLLSADRGTTATTASSGTTGTTATWDQVLVSGGTVSDDLILNAMLAEEDQP